MPNNLSEQIRECLKHAEDCARLAAAQTSPSLKEDLLDMEQHWLALARHYEFTQRPGAKRQADKLNGRRSASITPFLRDEAFDPETVEAMANAFATTRKALGLSSRDDAMTRLVAEKIIELAQRGLKNPTALHLAAIKEFKFEKTDTPSEEPIKALLLCPNCNVEMCLFGIEAESDERDLHTFECSDRGGVEVRGVRVNKTPPVVIVSQ